MSTDGQLNEYTWLPYKTCNMISCFHLKSPCSFVRGKIFFSAVKFYLLSKSVINEKYLDKYKNKKICSKIRVVYIFH